jgi:hypothetical protein
MQITPVTSSNIDVVSYDHDTQTMHVQFKSGKIYEYAGVTPEQHQALIDADSVGSHFAKHIRPNYTGVPVSS